MTHRAVLLVTVSLLLAPTAVEAVTFNLVYRGPGSASPDPDATTNPDDPSGALLAAHMQEAAAEWTDIVEDAHVMTIDYFYAGSTAVPSETANARTLTPNVNGSRTVLGEIKFYDSRSWYYDPNPQSDNEFGMTPVLLGDLSVADQDAGFRQGVLGSPLLEVGYRGGAVVANSPADNGFDLLSAARHEIGHLMGVTSTVNLLQAGGEAGLDEDYDFDPALVGGASLAVIVRDDPDDGITIAHFESAPPLMSGIGTNVGVRFDISATDVFAAAAVGNWSSIDLPRQDYLRINNDFATPRTGRATKSPARQTRWRSGTAGTSS